MRFASLGSGSRGNALLVELGQTLILIDCGLTRRAVEQRLGELGRDPRDVAAVLVSHEHSDHVRGVSAFVRRYPAPVWMTAGTASASSSRSLPGLALLSCREPLQIGEISVEPYPVPHDAREPCQFVFSGGGKRLGVLSDAGHITPHIRTHLADCDGLALEFNHDVDALWTGGYPEHLKRRIASPRGHLDNDQAAQLLSGIGESRLQWVVALHLSESNNSPERVRASLHAGLGPDHPARTCLAEQHAPSGWMEIV